MSRHQGYGSRRSPARIFMMWLGVSLSIGLLLATGAAVKSSFASLRSCDANNSGLTVVNCGKAAPNITDFFLLGLFVLSAVLVVSLFTGAWRMIRGKQK